MKIVARPSLKRVNAATKATVQTLRPSSAIIQQAVRKPVTTNKPAPFSLAAVDRKLNVSKLPVTRPAKLGAAAPTKKKNGPKILYSRPEVTSADLQKIRELRNVGVGKVLVILGNGPSINELNLRPLVSNSRVDMMSINKPVGYLWPSKYWLFCDQSQWIRHRDMWESYNGIILNTTAVRSRKHNTIQIKNTGGFGFSTDLTTGFNVGRSSVYAAMQVAAWCNYDHVYILGCDMAAVKIDGQLVTHYFGINPDVSPEVRVSRFAAEAKYYTHAAGHVAADLRAKFTFASDYNTFAFVDKFNRASHLGIVERILESVGS